MANQQHSGSQSHQGTDKEKTDQTQHPGQHEQSGSQKSGQHGGSTPQHGQQGDTRHDQQQKK